MQTVKLVAILLAAIFIFAPLMNASVKAMEMGNVNTELITEFKTYSNATTEDNFSDDSVMVVMTNSASLTKLEYSPSDFSKIDCKSVTNLTEGKTDKVAIKLSGGDAEVSHASASESAQVNGLNIDLNTFNQILLLELEETGKDKVLTAIKVLEQRSDVLYAGPNYIYSIDTESVTSDKGVSAYAQAASSRAVTTNDTYASNQWAINKINLASAWQITNGTGNCVTVGIIDFGVNASHPELNSIVNVSASRRIYHTGHVSTAGATDDPSGHGTMIAGVIGADTNNRIGISGINWNVSIVSLNIYNGSDDPTTASFVEAVNYAESLGIKILNCSLNVNRTLDEYCDDGCDICIYHCLKGYDGLLICSAGNTSENIDEDNERWLTSLDLNNIIVVGASTENDGVWFVDEENGSNFGRGKVDLFAPGELILSSVPENLCLPCDTYGNHFAKGYHEASGTSIAAPYVAGVASLIMSKYPNLSIEQVKNRIMRSIDMETAFFGKCVSAGRLNAYKALHNHSFTGMHDPFDTLYHMSYCTCGAYDLLPHNWVTIGDFEACSDCSYVMQ